MRDMVFQIYNRIGIKSERSKNIVNHIGWSLFYRIGSMASNLLMVPLAISYLDSENYGVWLTLSSFIGWFSFLDVGLGNGLRNKFAEAKARDDFEKAQAYVSTAYGTIGCVSLIAIIFFLGINQFIEWTQVFNTRPSLQGELSVLLPIIITFFCVQLIVKLVTSIYQADQNHSIQGKIQFFVQFLSVIAIWILTFLERSSLLIFGVIYSALPVVLLTCLNFFAFKKRFKKYKPNISLWKKQYFNEITGLGFSFFIIQISGIILFSTDNYIITKLFGPAQVVPYSIAFKYFGLAYMVVGTILTPYWSSVTLAYAKQELTWIKKSMKNLMRIVGLAIIGVFIMLVLSDTAYKIWIGDLVNIPGSLSICMAFYFIITIFYSLYNNFLNGLGKIKIQMYTVLITSIINIPLSIFLARELELGVKGVILSTIICVLPQAILSPIQYWKIISGKASGVWNK
ncbi:MATE family efflux transporter [Gramella sp. BOM4]|nr:MATE family efflux transporter [Christiangramia bathymodioli]